MDKIAHNLNPSPQAQQFLEPFQKIDTAWFVQHDTPQGKIWRPLDNIESMTVDRFSKQYKKYKIESSRFVNIGHGSKVDLANWVQFSTSNHSDDSKHLPVRVGLNHVR